MPFYPGDYLRDTIGLTLAQHGAYLLVILAYWSNKGPITESDARAAMRDALQSDCDRIASFFKIESGKWHHKRIDAELRQAKKNRISRTRAATIANKARWGKKLDKFSNDASRDASGNASGNASVIRQAVPSPSPSYSTRSECVHSSQREGGPGETHETGAGNPTLDEVLAYAAGLHCGLAEWKARDWWQEMESCGWLDHQKRPVVKWQALLQRVKTKWVSDGCPPGPPQSKGYGNGQRQKPILPPAKPGQW